MTSLPNIRRPRTAFLPVRLPPPLRNSRRRTLICSLDPPATTDIATTSPDRAREVQTRLETTRTRVRQLHSRAIVRAGSASIARGTDLLDGKTEVDDERDVQAVFAQLRRDLRALRRAADELPTEDPAPKVVTELQGIVDALEERLVSGVKKGVSEHEEVEEVLEEGGGVDEDTQWVNNVVVEEVEFVEKVRRKVAEGGDMLKRRASSVGAGIEDRVAEFVKEDGSVDVEGLRKLLGRILDNAGMTWKRLNGWVEKEEGVVGVSVRDADKEFWLREEIGTLEKKLIESSREREAVLRREDQLGKLIRAREIRLMDDAVSALRRTLAVRVLQLEMEKILVGVAEEIDNADEQSILDQRVLVVEFGDLDERLATLDLFVVQEEPLLIDDDVLGELAADIQDLKLRLGLDEALYSSVTLSWAQFRQFLTSSAKKSRQGVEFYSRGMRLFLGDLRFALRLVRRAILGYTPSPREVRTLRRTGRDLITLIPFTIFLIAPLTPVGHVLIFSFLQKYWPEFFPSTFSERRQAVMKRHEEYRRSLREEENGANGNGVEEAQGNPGVLGGLKRRLKASETEATGESTGNGIDTEIADEHPVELSNLAEEARDNEKMARKKRISVALEELHLAD